jgi:poly [ADP-ribose] polymerase
MTCPAQSANYCHATPENPYGLLLLCEVALGTPWELRKARFVDKLPQGKQSVKGVFVHEKIQGQCSFRLVQFAYLPYDHANQGSEA